MFQDSLVIHERRGMLLIVGEKPNGPIEKFVEFVSLDKMTKSTGFVRGGQEEAVAKLPVESLYQQ